MQLLAAGSVIPGFLPELVALIGGAAIVGYISSRARVVPIVGFLLAGILIGPAQLGLVREREVVDAAAEIGVILLLFTIGIEFSLERLTRMARLIGIAGGAQVTLATGVTAGIAYAFGVPGGAAIFTGMIVALSSTAIVLKVLHERHEMEAPHGRGGVGILLFQDLAVVAMVLLVPALAGSGGGAGGVGIALLTAGGLVAGALVFARRVLPTVLDAVARTCSAEVFLLALVAICFGTALLSAAVGVSVSLGAFLAGLIVSESRHGTHAFAEILPLQILFSATFFVSVGMLVDLGFLIERPWLVLGAVAGVLVVKASTTTIAARIAGLPLRASIGIGLLLAQLGEFSFVLEALGREDGLSPLDLGEDGAQTLVATTVLLMIASPLFASLAAKISARDGAQHAPGETGDAQASSGHRSGHVLVLGYGAAARALIGELWAMTDAFTMVTLNPDGAAELQADGIDVVVGDYAKRTVLLEAGVDKASAVVVADDVHERTVAVVELVRVLAPGVPVIARPTQGDDIDTLAAVGADYVLTPTRASALDLGATMRHVLVPGPTYAPLSAVIRFVPSVEGSCPHVDAIRPVQPSAPGCEDCLRAGRTWVHLRICLTCGHVGCCDSSPDRHARAHADDGHPIVASFEPGDRWAHCFLDATTMATSDTLPIG